MTKFFASGFGKSVQALLYVFVSTGLAALVAAIQNNPAMAGGLVYSGIVVGIINALLVFVQKALDPKTPTFPNSPVA